MPKKNRICAECRERTTCLNNLRLCGKCLSNPAIVKRRTVPKQSKKKPATCGQPNRDTEAELDALIAEQTANAPDWFRADYRRLNPCQKAVRA